MLKLQKCIFIFRLLKQRAALTRNEINNELRRRWPEELPMSRGTFGNSGYASHGNLPEGR